MKFVGRAGEKLDFALKNFKIEVSRKICADFGSAIGGFTDCLLKAGAKKVYAVEKGYGVLDWKLRNDPRVVVMERTNTMHVILPEKADLITIDVGWTRQEKILPNALKNLKADGQIISLIKPHYEIGKGRLTEEEAEKIKDETVQKIKSLGVKIKAVIKSPLLGAQAENVEYLALLLVNS